MKDLDTIIAAKECYDNDDRDCEHCPYGYGYLTDNMDVYFWYCNSDQIEQDMLDYLKAIQKNKKIDSRFIADLRDHANWADANIFDVPITLPDDLRQAANYLEAFDGCSTNERTIAECVIDFPVIQRACYTRGYCSNCKKVLYGGKINYCQHCGAKLGRTRPMTIAESVEYLGQSCTNCNNYTSENCTEGKDGCKNWTLKK
jgi:hypothetical protein